MTDNWLMGALAAQDAYRGAWPATPASEGERQTQAMGDLAAQEGAVDPTPVLDWMVDKFVGGGYSPRQAAEAAINVIPGARIPRLGKAPLDVGGGLGGAPGGEAGLREAYLSAKRRAGGREPLPGLPTDPQVVEGRPFVPGPIGAIHDVAERYMAGRNYGVAPPEKFYPLDKERSRAIAQAYDALPLYDPAAVPAYDAMARETLAQYQAARAAGLRVTPIDAASYPYGGNPRAVAADVGDRGHMAFFKTEPEAGAFGTGGQANIAQNHPLLKQSGEYVGDYPMLNNDLFRVVHDYYGHLKHGFGFRAAGEDMAWRTHAPMYSPQARGAMTSETRGQNSWVNYGPHGDFNRTASAADTIYAPQKVGIMPAWTMGDLKKLALAGGSMGALAAALPTDQAQAGRALPEAVPMGSFAQDRSAPWQPGPPQGYVHEPPPGPDPITGPVRERHRQHAGALGSAALNLIPGVGLIMQGANALDQAMTPFQPETPGVWTEDDQERFNRANAAVTDAAVGTAFNMTVPWGLFRPQANTLVASSGGGRNPRAVIGGNNPPREFQMPAPGTQAWRDAPLPNAPFAQYAEQYPTPGPPTMMPKDKPTYPGEMYPEKVLTPEAQVFDKARAKIMADMRKRGFVPYFDPEKRGLVDPSKYPAPNVDTSTVRPSREDTIKKYRDVIYTPETKARLEAAYARGEELGNADNWYFMSQLENEYIKELGAKAGRAAFLDEFAVPLAATTSGQRPGPNLMTAHYLEFLRKRGEEAPTEAHQLPTPVGGRRAAVNLRDYLQMRGRGGYSGLGEDQPKMHDFSRSMIGDLRNPVIDEQMGEGMLAGHPSNVISGARNSAYGYLQDPVRELAAEKGKLPGAIQDVAWAGFKGEAGKPMIQIVNEAIERTHRLTGLSRSEIVRRGLVRKEIPLYGLGLLTAGGGAMGELADQGKFKMEY